MGKIVIPDREIGIQPARLDATPGLAIAENVARFGQNIQKIHDDFAEKARQARVANEVSTRYTDAVKSYGTWFTDRATKVNGYKTLFDEHQKQSLQIRQNAFNGVTDADVKKQLELKFNDYFTRQELNVKHTARTQEINEIKQNMLNDLEKQKELAISSNKTDSMDIVNTFKTNLASQVTAGVINQAKADELLRKFNSDVQEGRIVNLMRNNPGAAYNMLKGTNDIPGMTPQRRLTLMSAAKTLAKQKSDTDLSQVRELYRSDIQSIANTGEHVPGAYERAKKMLPAKEFKAYDQARINAIQYSSDMNIAKYGSDEDKKRMIKERSVKGGDPQYSSKAQYLQALGKGIAQIEKEKQSDPAKWAGNHPLISGDIAGNKQDKTEQQKQIESNPLGYYEKIINVQRQGGVPEHKISLLTNAEAKTIISNIEALTPDKKPIYLESLKQKYGDKYYPIIVKDLAANGLPIGSQLYLQVQDDPAGQQLLSEVQKVKPEEVKKGIEKDVVNQIKKDVASKLNNYEKSVIAGNPSIPLTALNSLKDELTYMAMYKYKQTGSVSSASDYVVSKFINSKFDYRDSKIGINPNAFTGYEHIAQVNIRVPVGHSKEAAVSMIENMHNPNKIYDFIKGNDVILSDEKKLTKEKKWKIYAKAVMESGTWVTSPDNTGVMLLDQNKNPVFNKQGQAYGFKFNQADTYLKIKQDPGKTIEGISPLDIINTLRGPDERTIY